MEPKNSSNLNQDHYSHDLNDMTPNSQISSTRRSEAIQSTTFQIDTGMLESLLESDDIQSINSTIFQFQKKTKRVPFQIIYKQGAKAVDIQSVAKKLYYGENGNQAEVIQKLPR